MKLFVKSILFLSVLFFASNINGQELKEIYEKEDTAALRQYLETNDPNECSGGYTLLMKFIIGGKKNIAKYLIDHGVKVDESCSKQRTALMLAAQHDHPDIGKWLVEAGADVTLEDHKGNTALSIAAEMEHQDFLQSILKFTYQDHIGFDGPYILFGEKNEINQVIPNQKNKPTAKITLLEDEAIYDQVFTAYSDTGRPLFNFSIKDKFLKEKSWYKMPKKLVAISDIEGDFPAFTNLLKSTGVVDEKLNWKYGEGHLVLLGDYFDRGNQVTECLWLIYKLEQEAEVAGGKVHFIIGNHEAMNLEGDLRYVHQKYYANAISFNKEYKSFYDENSFLGKWLRTKNVAVKIGKYLFVHAGISPQFAVKNIDFHTLNKTAKNYYGMPVDSLQADTVALAIFDQLSGPLWYRGYFDVNLTTEMVEATLNYIGVKKVVIGHTPVTNIKHLHNGRVVSIDVPHALGEKYQQALFIEKGKFYAVNLDGRKVEISD